MSRSEFGDNVTKVCRERGEGGKGDRINNLNL